MVFEKCLNRLFRGDGGQSFLFVNLAADTAQVEVACGGILHNRFDNTLVRQTVCPGDGGNLVGGGGVSSTNLRQIREWISS